MTEISKSLILIYVACGNVRCYKAICQRCWNMFRRAYFLKMFFLAGYFYFWPNWMIFQTFALPCFLQYHGIYQSKLAIVSLTHFFTRLHYTNQLCVNVVYFFRFMQQSSTESSGLCPN